MKCSSDAQKRLQQSITAGALQGLSYIPGAIPALGNTMLAVISGQAAAAVAAATGMGAAAATGAPAAAASAPIANGARAPSLSAAAGGAGAQAEDPMLASPFASVGDEKVTI